METYIVIAYTTKQDQITNKEVMIYNDQTERFIEGETAAMEYRQYLADKGEMVIVAPITIHTSLNPIPITQLKITDALSKLTANEIELLGLNP